MNPAAEAAPATPPSPPRRGWKDFKHALGYRVFQVVHAVLSRLPEFCIFALGHLLGFILSCSPLCWRAQKHIRMAYGDAAPSAKYPTSAHLARACMRHYGMTVAEAFLLDRWLPRFLDHCAIPPELETLRKHLEEGKRGLVFCTFHLGNWEVFGRALAASGIQVATVAKETFDPRLADWVYRWRLRGGVQAENRGTKEMVRLIRNHLAKGGGFGVMLDMDTNVKSVWVPFFGRQTRTPAGGADLALRFDTALMIGCSYRLRPGKHQMWMQEVDFPKTGNREHDILTMTTRLTEMIERMIREHPEQWLWANRRWKATPPPAELGRSESKPADQGLPG